MSDNPPTHHRPRAPQVQDRQRAARLWPRSPVLPFQEGGGEGGGV